MGGTLAHITVPTMWCRGSGAGSRELLAGASPTPLRRGLVFFGSLRQEAGGSAEADMSLLEGKTWCRVSGMLFLGSASPPPTLQAEPLLQLPPTGGAQPLGNPQAKPLLQPL